MNCDILTCPVSHSFAAGSPGLFAGASVVTSPARGRRKARPGRAGRARIGPPGIVVRWIGGPLWSPRRWAALQGCIFGLPHEHFKLIHRRRVMSSSESIGQYTCMVENM